MIGFLFFCAITWMHGTQSSALLMAIEETDATLLPTGELQKRGLVPYTGELRKGVSGINQTHLSGSKDWRLCLHYATAYPFDLDAEIARVEEVLERRDALSEKTLQRAAFAAQRVRQFLPTRFDWEALPFSTSPLPLSAKMKEALLHPFPVIIASETLDPQQLDEKEWVVPGSACLGSDLQFLYVPPDHLDRAKALFSPHGLEVESLDSLN